VPMYKPSIEFSIEDGQAAGGNNEKS